MKIRTIASGLFFESPKQFERIAGIAGFNQKAKSFFEKEGYEVQTTRISTNSWEEYLSGKEVVGKVRQLENVCKKEGITFFSIGPASSPENIGLVPDINRSTSIIYASANIGSVKEGINTANINASARAIKEVAGGNFRFCASANCCSGIPFFPASFHEGRESSFSVGMECSDLAAKSFSGSKSIKEAKQNFEKLFFREMKLAEKVALEVSGKFGMKYGGIDVSLAPSLYKKESIAFAFEKLGFGKFGGSGTLAIASMVTDVLKSTPVKRCGYSGLMLPVCEDFGLAERANEGAFGVRDLLMYSAVCGVGLDTVPIPGDVPVKKIEALLLDVASLSIKLNKPLSARLLPISGKSTGEMTSFNSPYLLNCRIFEV